MYTPYATLLFLPSARAQLPQPCLPHPLPLRNYNMHADTCIRDVLDYFPSLPPALNCLSLACNIPCLSFSFSC